MRPPFAVAVAALCLAAASAASAQTKINIGIVTSLIMPSEALWKKALALFQPGFASSPVMAGPLAVTSQPSDLMIGYAVAYMVALLALALWSFSCRDL